MQKLEDLKVGSQIAGIVLGYVARMVSVGPAVRSNESFKTRFFIADAKELCLIGAPLKDLG